MSKFEAEGLVERLRAARRDHEDSAPIQIIIERFAPRLSRKAHYTVKVIVFGDTVLREHMAETKAEALMMASDITEAMAEVYGGA